MTRVLVCLLLSVQPIVRMASVSSSGTITAQDGTVELAIPVGVGFGSVGVEVRGTWTGTIQTECLASLSGGAFVAVSMTPRNTQTVVTSTTANGQWVAVIAGCQRVRARATAAMTGTATLTLVGGFS